MTDGTLSVRRREPKASEASEQETKTSALAGGAYEYFADMEAVFGTGHIKAKGKGLPPVIGAADEIRVETRRRDKLKEYDRMLKAFKYSAALDAGLNKVGTSGRGRARGHVRTGEQPRTGSAAAAHRGRRGRRSRACSAYHNPAR